MRRLIGRCLVALLCAGGFVGTQPEPAEAAVWSCTATTDQAYNYAYAECAGGFGWYRVKTVCSTSSWPYTTTIYGSWVYKSSSEPLGPASWVSGDSHSCHVVSSAVQVQ
jgi:hypothetical protein